MMMVHGDMVKWLQNIKKKKKKQFRSFMTPSMGKTKLFGIMNFKYENGSISMLF